MSLSREHLNYLVRAGYSEAKANEHASTYPGGILFEWESVTGKPENGHQQRRPDSPAIDPKTGKPQGKYLSTPKGRGNVLGTLPSDRDKLLKTEARIVFTEGTKQWGAVSSALAGDPDNVAVGLAGCWGWRTADRGANPTLNLIDGTADSIPVPDLNAINWLGRHYVIAFDKDVSTNMNVNRAARKLEKELRGRGAVCDGYIIRDDEASGLDDVLALGAGDSARADIMAGLLANLKPRPVEPEEDEDTKAANGAYWAQVDVGQRFADAHHERLIHVGSVVSENWHAWDGKCWAPIKPENARAIFHNWIRVQMSSMEQSRDFSQSAYNGAKQYRRTSNVNAAMFEARSTPVMNYDPAEMNTRVGVLPVNNGEVDLRTGVLTPAHDRDALWTYTLPGDFLGLDATHTDVDKLCSALDEPGVLDYVFTFIGAAATHEAKRGDPWLFFQGSGRNAKGAFCETVQAVLGSNMTKALDKGLLKPDKYRDESLLLELMGSRLGFFEELTPDHEMPLDRLKVMSDTDLISVRRPYDKAPTTFQNRCSILCNTNDLPVIRGRDESILRRIRLVTWHKTYRGDARDATLKARLCEVDRHPAMLALIVAGAMRFYASGMSHPDADECPPDVIKSRNEWLDGTDPMRQFVDECIQISLNPEHFATNKELVDEYASWAPTKMSANLLTKRLKEVSVLQVNGVRFDARKRLTGGRQARGVVGIRVGPQITSDELDLDVGKVVPFVPVSTDNKEGVTAVTANGELLQNSLNGNKSGFENVSEKASFLSQLSHPPKKDAAEPPKSADLGQPPRTHPVSLSASRAGTSG